MLKNGERQVAPTREGIRRDHVARYEWAAKVLGNGTAVDVACGVGYGTQILAEAGIEVTGIDKDVETIQYARSHYKHKKLAYLHTDAVDGIDLDPEVDAAVCFETIEHIKDPAPLLKSLHDSAKVLIASVPNEEVMPWDNYAFHFRHYTKNQFEQLLNDCGWTVQEWHGQEGRESDVEPIIYGRTLIAVAIRTEDAPPKRTKLRHVAILGLGPSVDQYTNVCKRLGGKHAFCDETWTINSLGSVIQSDLIFHMDDVRIQEIRAKAKPESNIARMLEWMKHTNVPIITSRRHDDYPTTVDFPLEQAINDLKHDYFNSTAAYAVAFAILMRVERISLFGCDFTYPNAHHAEKGRACVEFWLGVATNRGIKITLPKESTLMDAMLSSQERLYGYDTQDVILEADGDRMKVKFKDCEKLPTAEEIEAEYDHSVHPNALVAEATE